MVPVPAGLTAYGMSTVPLAKTGMGPVDMYSHASGIGDLVVLQCRDVHVIGANCKAAEPREVGVGVSGRQAGRQAAEPREVWH